MYIELLQLQTAILNDFEFDTTHCALKVIQK